MSALTLGCTFSDRVEALLDGRMTVPDVTFDLRIVAARRLFHQVLRGAAHDIAEQSMAGTSPRSVAALWPKQIAPEAAEAKSCPVRPPITSNLNPAACAWRMKRSRSVAPDTRSATIAWKGGRAMKRARSALCCCRRSASPATRVALVVRG